MLVRRHFVSRHFVIVVLCCVVSQLSCQDVVFSSIDLKEMDSIQYDMSIGNVPVLESSLELEQNVGIPMVNKFGQKYHCKLPQDTSDEGGDIDGETKKAQKVVHSPANIPELLAPMAEEPCLIKTKDWWSYEVCYKKIAKQYHMEDGRPSGAIMILGHYDHDYEWSSRNTNHETGEESEEIQITPRHHKQFYSNGSSCDLTGDPRKTEVWYECDPQAVVDYISRVDEPQSCEYVIVVKTSKICSIPQLRPPPTKKPKMIECLPILNDIEFKKYENFKKAQELHIAQKKKDSEIQRKKQLLKVLEGEDLTGIDIETEEGLLYVEKRVGEKMAEKLVSELGLMLDKTTLHGQGKIRAYGSLEELLKTDDAISDTTEHIMTNGQRQSRIVKSKNANWDTLSDQKQRLDRKDLGFKKKIEKKVEKVEKPVEKAEKTDKIAEKTDKIAEKTDKFGKSSDKKVEKTDKKGEQFEKYDDDDDEDYVNLDPRSDLSDEDEMIETLFEVYKKISGSKDMTLSELKDELKKLQDTMGESIEDIIKETEGEMNIKLDGIDRHNAIDQLSQTMNLIMSKLDATEADIQRVDGEIEKAQEIIDSSEEMFASAKKNEEKKEKKENSDDTDEEKENNEAKTVNVKITNVSPLGLGSSEAAAPSQERVIKHLEASIKERLERSNLDTGGRQIEVKLITTQFSDVADSSEYAMEDEMGEGDTRQWQQMLFNLMVGDTSAYNDMDHQWKSEKNYQFNYDESQFKPTESETADSDNSS